MPRYNKEYLMTVELFSVYDSAARAFMEPFHAPTIESAIRSFRHTVNKGNNQISQFPEDYTLFHIGTFNQEEGTVSALATPANLGVAITFLESGKQIPMNLHDEKSNG